MHQGNLEIAPIPGHDLFEHGEQDPVLGEIGLVGVVGSWVVGQDVAHHDGGFRGEILLPGRRLGQAGCGWCRGAALEVQVVVLVELLGLGGGVVVHVHGMPGYSQRRAERNLVGRLRGVGGNQLGARSTQGGGQGLIGKTGMLSGDQLVRIGDDPPGPCPEPVLVDLRLNGRLGGGVEVQVVERVIDPPE